MLAPSPRPSRRRPLGARCNFPGPDFWTVPTSDTLPLPRPISRSSISARPSARDGPLWMRGSVLRGFSERQGVDSTPFWRCHLAVLQFPVSNWAVRRDSHVTEERIRISTGTSGHLPSAPQKPTQLPEKCREVHVRPSDGRGYFREPQFGQGLGATVRQAHGSPAAAGRCHRRWPLPRDIGAILPPNSPGRKARHRRRPRS